MTHVTNLIVWADMGLATETAWQVDAIECKSQFHREKYAKEIMAREFNEEHEMIDFFGEDGWTLGQVIEIPVVMGKRYKYYFHRIVS